LFIMNLEPLQKKLLAAARAHPPSDRVPYAFEQRISAHLKALPPVDLAAFWARALWRAAVPCAAFTLLLATWSFAPISTSSTTTEDLSQQFEQTLLADADQLEESW
jgi:hypothetical protein